MKEKYIKLKPVIDILYANKTIDDSRIDPEAINEILALPTEEIEVNQELNVINNKEYNLLKVLKELKNPPHYKDYDFRDFTSINTNSYIPEACRNCSNHPSNGGSGNCNCILGLPRITAYN